MLARHLWIAVLIALAAWGVSALAAGEAPVLRPGETVRFEMPKGDPDNTSVALTLIATEDRPLTVETSTLHFDTLLRLFSADPAPDAEPLAEDEDGGIGWNSRLTFDAAAGRSYTIEVRPNLDDWGGPFEVSASHGEPPADESQKRLHYWDLVAAEGERTGSETLRGRAALGRAEIATEAGDHAAARGLCEEALESYSRAVGPEHPRSLFALEQLAASLRDGGEFPVARTMYERALAIHERVNGPEHASTALLLNSLAGLLNVMGESEAARAMYERVLAISEKVHGPEHPNTAIALNNLALLLQAQVEYAAARPMCERALAILEKAFGPEHGYTALALGNLGSLLESMGDYATARPMYERALAIEERVFGPEDMYTALALNSLGVLFKAMGDNGAARPLLQRSLAILEKAYGPEHPYTAPALVNVATLLEAMGDHAAARPLLERALAIGEKAYGPEHPVTAATLASLAGVLETTGEYAAARPLYERALAINQKALGPAHCDVALNLGYIARLRAKQGDIVGALDQALDAERIGRDHLRVTGRSVSEREALRYATVRKSGLDLALTLAARDLEPSLCRRTLDALVQSRALVLDEMAARHRAVGESADPEVARLAEHLRSRRTRLANLVVRGPGGQSGEAYRALLEEARREKEQAERALAGSSREFARELARGRLGLNEIAASLPDGSVLVSFSQYKMMDLRPKIPTAPGSNDGTPTVESASPVSSYIAFVLRAGARDPVVVDLGPATVVDTAVSGWKEQASRGLQRAGNATQAEADYREAGARLRQIVWDPLAAAIGAAARVLVVPDGSLNLVSFAALPADDGRYLIERGPLVHYVSAERDLVPGGGERRGEGLLALGGPRYDATRMFAALPEKQGETVAAAAYRGQRAACGDFAAVRFEALPATARETQDVVRLWAKFGRHRSAGAATGSDSTLTDVVDLRGAAATETALKSQAPGRRVLHLATHGFFVGGECETVQDRTRGIGGLAEEAGPNPHTAPPPLTRENPLLLSGLALAGANHRLAVAEGEDDGILTAEEIASLDLSGVEWAVLSACETGVGDVHAGEGVFGLRRAFRVAGAATLIMSLWSVDDEATRSWMKALYEGRLARGLDTAEAVRQASLTVMKQRRKAGLSAHPFYWGAFVAAGDWR